MLSRIVVLPTPNAPVRMWRLADLGTFMCVVSYRESSRTRRVNDMQEITPFLWFNDNAEEAMNFYTSVFEDSKILDVSRYGEGGPGTPGSVMSATFELRGQEFVALNGGPEFNFTEAVSFLVRCETQDEVDLLWKQLTEGGSESQCGWLKDKFGLSWQIVPNALGEMLGDPDPEKAQRVMQAMLKMKKLDIHMLQEAYGDPSS
jgi:predicted 3-demethylubiquinone-9 3-methyltransferase (glyoxalase superfamily)